MNPKLILLDIFSYSCMNCLRSLRFIKKIDKKYRKYGLETVLVHPPEWEFEKNGNNIAYALKKHRITLPVVVDKDKNRIKKLNVNFWPTQILIKNRKILYKHVGEGNYKKLENKIIKILGVNPKKRIFYKEPGYSSFPSVYLGKQKNGKIIKKGNKLKFREVYMEGRWIQKKECLENRGKGFLIIKTKGKIVNIAAKAIKNKPATIFIALDDKPLGRIAINRPDLYPLARINDHKQHKLTLMTKSKIAVYSFSFE